jgi:hypothetical protein
MSVLMSAARKVFHYVTQMEADFIICGNQVKGYRLKCSCGVELPPKLDQFYLTAEMATKAKRRHERTGK